MTRPVDLLFPQRKPAIESQVCIPPPLGCGGPATEFTDELSRREYYISGLCQRCQNGIFGGPAQ